MDIPLGKSAIAQGAALNFTVAAPLAYLAT
ncbi:hypothetical protein VSWAT3_08006 [Vibrionales bacterium SWAT-3]|nr:hypothetical protein VSWAT3_08006 [Vibrionales bacterium SWAT-3]